MQQSTWFTPEGLEDLLPPQAQKLEYYRRKLMDGFQSSGYDLVLPPLAEFTDSLLTGTARHTAIDTCRFTDQESGRMMGVRADMTPQVARIVSNRLKSKDIISRLCYVGEVLKTRNNKAKGSRSPIQVGAELFGHAGVESDIEIIELMLESMHSLNLQDIKMSLGHVAVVDELISLAGLDAAQSSELIAILERKAIPEYAVFLTQVNLPEAVKSAFNHLPMLCGDAKSVLVLSKSILLGLSTILDQALENIQGVMDYVEAHYSLPIHLDLADIRGYQYHTGIIFACYTTAGKLQPLAKGGRYDNIGSEFGLALPATGFSLDLRIALDLLAPLISTSKGTVYMPLVTDTSTSQSLKSKVNELKEQGYQVVKSYDLAALNPGSFRLVEVSGQWMVETV
ncbi:ATP phosphoribosyltransferase regulatory subunit [Thiomicrorhabdus aquaedulcis]|uniref:ATP phosphoribosyltransferase regulatory subunit n=1 Tax=Thiomicrorhabdus aquaedulcis TaxID=2211106 RepID=UPI000FD9CAD3|nr:ATP phosphoribosyltransferase regulatory subunit [Thiomicrorhabdus aquaedulcis]